MRRGCSRRRAKGVDAEARSTRSGWSCPRSSARTSSSPARRGSSAVEGARLRIRASAGEQARRPHPAFAAATRSSRASSRCTSRGRTRWIAREDVPADFVTAEREIYATRTRSSRSRSRPVRRSSRACSTSASSAGGVLPTSRGSTTPRRRSAGARRRGCRSPRVPALLAPAGGANRAAPSRRARSTRLPSRPPEALGRSAHGRA